MDTNLIVKFKKWINRTQSSANSLIALTARMKIKGVKVVHLPVGETSGICCKRAIKRKKQLEYLLNCSKRKHGRKLMAL